jgi:hypothetical protein
MTVELLEQRLEELAIETPDAGRVAAKVLSRRSRRRVRIPRIATASVAFVVLAALVAYFVPAADTAIASRVPWTGEVLQWAGLVGASDRITYVNSTATSSGYRISLGGVYADSTRTMLLMHVDPAIASTADPVVITDQFGRTYQFSGSSSNTLTGDIVMQFEPLAWPDSVTGARITLHVAHLETPSHATVSGSWDLTASLGVDVAKTVPVPAPADLGPAHFRFTSVTYTPATIEVDMEVTGVSGDELSQRIPDGLKGFQALQVDLLDPSGQVIHGNGSPSGDQNPNHIHAFGWRTGGGGKYTVRVSYYGYGSFNRELVIPS